MQRLRWLLVSCLCALGLLVACGSSSKDGNPGGAAGAPPSGGSGGAAGAGVAGGTSEPGVTIIQEDTLGFAALDGNVLPRQGSTSVTGFTGTGFADPNPGIGNTISWSVKAETAGTYALIFRYAFGGTATNLRDARLVVNGAVVADPFVFEYTNTWNDWRETAPIEVEFPAGSVFIQLEALFESGLPNIDYLKILGEGITPDRPSFTLSVEPNDAARGSVSYEPVQDYYALGSSIGLSATANPGFFFQSWTGDVTSASAEHSFTIERNSRVTALFLPDGATADPDVIGYATVQDDRGTPFLLNGGALGETVDATTFEELKAYLEAPEPMVVRFSGLFEGADAINVASDKTLLGVGAGAHLRGIGLVLAGVRNVIVQNVAISHVVAEGAGPANDAIEITAGSKNVWIDHCELYSDLLSGEDYYDGLVEIKNESAFVTVSWSVFHDHFKASLVSSGDEQFRDAAIRVTYHHNYFHDVGSRMPSIRFGLAHVFNNYYLNNPTGSCVNTRMNAVARVEHNYFENSKNPIGSWDSPIAGLYQVVNNVFAGCTGSQPTTSTGSLVLPYEYALDPVEDTPAIVMAGAGVGKL